MALWRQGRWTCGACGQVNDMRAAICVGRDGACQTPMPPDVDTSAVAPLDTVPVEPVEEAAADERDFCAKRTRTASAVDFTKWYATDFEWPRDGERGAATAQNQEALRALGVVVVEESVDAMNVGAFLRSQGIDADDVVLAVLNGMCSRVGADNNEYRQTQAELGVPAGCGPQSCVFAALTAALPQATVLVSATGTGKQQTVSGMRVRQTMTRPVVCREVHYPEPIKGVGYKPESNDSRYRMLPDPIPVGLVAIGPAIGHGDPGEFLLFGKERRTMDMGSLVIQATATGGVLLFLGEFTCTSVLHLAYDAEQMRAAAHRRCVMRTWPYSRSWSAASAPRLSKERMLWDATEYDYEETVAHCEKKLLGEGKSVRHVGMHAANLWLYQARGLHITKFQPGADWYPAGGSSVSSDMARMDVS